MLIYRLYMMSVYPVSVITLVSCIVIFKTAQHIHKTISLYLLMVKLQIGKTTKAKYIKDLLKKIKKINPAFDEQNLVGENNAYLIDKVLLNFPSLPIREKGNTLHVWDVTETIYPLIAHAIRNKKELKCPNGCDKKLELENAVDTGLQDEIIALLEKALTVLKP